MLIKLNLNKKLKNRSRHVISCWTIWGSTNQSGDRGGNKEMLARIFIVDSTRENGQNKISRLRTDKFK